MANNNPNIKGAPFKPEGGRPANFSNPTGLIKGSVKSVGSIRGGQNSGIERKSEYFMKSQASGPKTVKTTQPRG